MGCTEPFGHEAAARNRLRPESFVPRGHKLAEVNHIILHQIPHRPECRGYFVANLSPPKVLASPTASFLFELTY